MESRRRFLRSAIAMLVAGSVLVAGDWIMKLESIFPVPTATSSPQTNEATVSRDSLISVRVYYSMMAAYANLGDELFVLQSPASLQRLLDTVIVRHPSLNNMMQMMMTLVNGIPSKSSRLLKDGDEVQFIPLTAGG